MLELPKRTEISKQLTQKALYEKFRMTTASKKKFDDDIKKTSIVNEVSPTTTSIAKGDTVSSFFVLHIHLKQKSFDEKNISLISKLIAQKMLFILEYEGMEGKTAKKEI